MIKANHNDYATINNREDFVKYLESQEGMPFDKGAIFKAGFTPVRSARRFELLSKVQDKLTIKYVSDNQIVQPHVCVIDGKNEDKSDIRTLIEGYYVAKCIEIIELYDNRTLLLIFEPYDSEGWRYTGISLTLSKVISESEALGEFIFGAGQGIDNPSSSASLVIRNVDAFKDLVLGKSFGIEVSVNIETGWLYITDFFNLVGTDEFPTCPMEIVRNVF